MSANEKSPNHYTAQYQHWDLAVTIPLGYLEGCTTKYVTRWRHKNGVDDLYKAIHYLDKLIEVYASKQLARNLNRSEIQYEVSRFAAANKLSIIEEEYVLLLSNYRTDDELRTARLVLEDIIELAKESIRLGFGSIPEPNYPGTPDDGGHHAAGQADSEEL